VITAPRGSSSVAEGWRSGAAPTAADGDAHDSTSLDRACGAGWPADLPRSRSGGLADLYLAGAVPQTGISAGQTDRPRHYQESRLLYIYVLNAKALDVSG
jgi:hypothetical protein